MIPISEAIDIIIRETLPLGSETVELGQSVGRVLAKDVVADGDLPPFDRSQMDGFAVRAMDTKNAPVELRIVGESAAGKGWHRELKSGEAVRIMTGAPVPMGADAVQKLELANENGENVEIRKPVEKGKFIVGKGFEVKKGNSVFAKGEIISANMVASLAAFGYSAVKVSVTPNVAILSTGSEIVAIDQTPGQDNIRDSNSAMLKALVEECGSKAEILPFVGDDFEKLKTDIARAVNREKGGLSTQILIITGGVSVGKYDLTKPALLELGAEIFFDRVQLKPGKPTVFGKLNGTLIFGLPGNPVSAAVTFYLFVRKAVLMMQNALQTGLKQGFAVLNDPVKGVKERDSYFPASLKTDEQGRLLAKPLKWYGSSDFIGFAKADALIILPKGETFNKGDVVGIAYLISSRY